MGLGTISGSVLGQISGNALLNINDLTGRLLETPRNSFTEKLSVKTLAPTVIRGAHTGEPHLPPSLPYFSARRNADLLH